MQEAGCEEKLTVIIKITTISLCTQLRGSQTGECLEKGPSSTLSFTVFPYLCGTGRAARQNAQGEKTLLVGQSTERKKWKGRQRHKLWFHLHCPPQFFHRKVCVVMKWRSQLLKRALSHWTTSQESINSLLLPEAEHTEGMGQGNLFINNLQERIHPHTQPCHWTVNSAGKRCLLSYPVLHFWSLPKKFKATAHRAAAILQKIILIPKSLLFCNECRTKLVKADSKVCQKSSEPIFS